MSLRNNRLADLEGAVCDLDEMCELAAHFIEDTVNFQASDLAKERIGL